MSRIRSADVLNAYIKKNIPTVNLSIKKKIGVGSFGSVYTGKFNDNKVAIKVEYIHGKLPDPGKTRIKNKRRHVAPPTEDDKSYCTTLADEAKIYNKVNPRGNIKTMPECLWYYEDREVKIMVMTKLGCTIESLSEKYGKGTLSPYTVMVIAYQILLQLREIHSHGIVHKDIKPSNMAIVSNKGNGQNSITLFDYGLSRTCLRSDGSHITNRTRNYIEGTPRYMGIHTHKSHETSRRDDFQALGYTLISLLRGKLPWQGMNITDKSHLSGCAKREAILSVKEKLSASELCKGLDSIFEKFIEYSSKLGFSEPPNHEYWIAKFQAAANNINGELEWHKKRTKCKHKPKLIVE